MKHRAHRTMVGAPPWPAWQFLLLLIWIGLAAGCRGADRVTYLPPTPKPVVVFTLFISGSRPDSNGFSLTMDGVPIAQLTTNTQLELKVDPGTHTFALSGLADNCAVTNQHPRTVGIGAVGRTAVSFFVFCPRLAALDITTVTTGTDPDPDGYLLSIDGLPRDTLGVQDAAHFSALRPGSYRLRLSSVSTNCSVDPVTVFGDGRNRVIQVVDGSDASAQFSITCVVRAADTPGEKLVIAVRGSSNEDTNLYLTDVDGRGSQRLTDDEGDESAPEISPSGDRILFLKAKQLMLLDRASRKESSLQIGGVERAVWALDGNRIAYARAGRLWLMNADGTGTSVLTDGSNDRDPYWSPDGLQIAFTRDSGVYAMDVDGSHLRRLTPVRGTYGAGPWSPDGRRLVVTLFICNDYYYYYIGFPCHGTKVPSDLRILDVATGALTGLTDTPYSSEWSAVWATDGRRIFYMGFGTGNADVFMITLSAAGAVQSVTNLTHSPVNEEWVSVGTVRAAASPARAARPRSP